jgi:hypothetical protein
MAEPALLEGIGFIDCGRPPAGNGAGVATRLGPQLPSELVKYFVGYVESKYSGMVYRSPFLPKYTDSDEVCGPFLSTILFERLDS